MEPNKYQQGKIYTIRSHKTEQIYIGSTTQPLHKRLYEHRVSYKSWLKDNLRHYYTSFEIIKEDDHYIELLEEYPCKSKAELNRREGEMMRQNACINKKIGGRTMKEYYHDKHEQILEEKKQYAKDNKDIIAQRRRKYYQDRKNKISVKSIDE